MAHCKSVNIHSPPSSCKIIAVICSRTELLEQKLDSSFSHSTYSTVTKEGQRLCFEWHKDTLSLLALQRTTLFSKTRTSTSDTHIAHLADPSEGNVGKNFVPQTVEKEAGHEVSERGDNAKKLYLNFVVMSIYFSANHGSVTSVIALASSFDPTLGSYWWVLLWVLHIDCCCGQYIIEATSAENVSCEPPLCTFCGILSVAVIFLPLPASGFFGATGGIGAGTLWVGQGSYFGERTKVREISGHHEEASGLFHHHLRVHILVLRWLSN